jgi:tripartite-type tricarboxylate transporter receptor subunit TctC
LSVGIELAKAGKLKVVGITGGQKFADYPFLSGSFDGLDMVAHVGLVLPKGTPKDISDYYKKVFGEAINSAEYKEFLKSINWYDSLSTPKNYETFVSNQRKKWIPVAETIQFN